METPAPTPTTAVRALIEQHSLSETEIVSRLAELGVKTSQPTINRIKRGASKFDFAVGEGLINLHKRLARSTQ